MGNDPGKETRWKLSITGKWSFSCEKPLLSCWRELPTQSSQYFEAVFSWEMGNGKLSNPGAGHGPLFLGGHRARNFEKCFPVAWKLSQERWRALSQCPYAYAYSNTFTLFSFVRFRTLYHAGHRAGGSLPGLRVVLLPIREWSQYYHYLHLRLQGKGHIMAWFTQRWPGSKW